ncbi:neutral zinc metallopeptidase [Klenkia taihuensis]|uniref:Predicted metalloprotease n=1 Tax=Klenkia taihuensis TaxID=1225127 RepID=A0A1I1KHH0_9ACTN|nr:neutral zinc metallopeptidase [Klenkia taihuensis]GHE10287.1 aminopeptidase [Klenkia taihuensis]SFC60015.1 Predicted metalloprotease [Klenkia taihuensis]
MTATSRPVALAAGLVSLALLVSGCGTSIVTGQASSAQPPITDVAPEQFPITGAAETPADVTARNALADLVDFWTQQFPEVYGEDFPQLAGGYFSVDPGDVDESAYPDGEIGCSAAPEEVEQNAFYCPPDVGASNEDSISYDRAFLQELADEYGRFLPALIMAHEFGHAIQGRVGYPANDTSINTETQADCFAGAWTRWVADGNASHETIRAPELDGLLAGYFIVRDPPGTSAEDTQAHGSYFDRVSAIQDGYDGGAAACRDNYESDRVFTQGEFTDADLVNDGNAPPDEVAGLIQTALPEYYTDSFPDDLGTDFSDPTIESFDGDAPGCLAPDTKAGFCADDDTVYYDETDLAEPAYDEIGDYAVLTAVAIPYGLAARQQLGLSTDDEDAIRSATCQAGAFSGAALYGEVPTIRLSPGDFDEAVTFLLSYGKDPTVFPDVSLSGFQLVDVFRQGFLYGLTSCGLEA